MEINIRTSTIFEHIECSLYRALLFVRVQPLRVTRPVIDIRSPRRSKTTTIPSSRPWISGIRIPARLPADQLRQRAPLTTRTPTVLIRDTTDFPNNVTTSVRCPTFATIIEQANL